MAFHLHEIEPALADPGFNPSLVILILDLPALGVRDCRAVPLDVALQAIRDITAQVIVSGHLERWQQELKNARAQGLVPVIKLWAVESKAWIEIHGVDISPTAKA